MGSVWKIELNSEGWILHTTWNAMYFIVKKKKKQMTQVIVIRKRYYEYTDIMWQNGQETENVKKFRGGLCIIIGQTACNEKEGY